MDAALLRVVRDQVCAPDPWRFALKIRGGTAIVIDPTGHTLYVSSYDIGLAILARTQRIGRCVLAPERACRRPRAALLAS